MPAGFRVQVDASAVARLAEDPDMAAFLDDVGAAKADRARELAPKRTGRGAASIDHEVGVDDDGAYARVGYRPEGYYMAFVELGTSDTTPDLHLRPALDEDLDT